mmetsp:Transcript_19071/g.36762  ORF Transcript_19071/g.36762 Transcript_19071/m.36762 type:complete len:201 (-) Transcript_19071:1721-2323(-)
MLRSCSCFFPELGCSSARATRCANSSISILAFAMALSSFVSSLTSSGLLTALSKRVSIWLRMSCTSPSRLACIPSLSWSRCWIMLWNCICFFSESVVFISFRISSASASMRLQHCAASSALLFSKPSASTSSWTCSIMACSSFSLTAMSSSDAFRSVSKTSSLGGPPCSAFTCDTSSSVRGSSGTAATHVFISCSFKAMR